MEKKRKEIKLIKPKKRRRKKKNAFVVWIKSWIEVIDIVIYSYTPNWMIRPSNKKYKKK